MPLGPIGDHVYTTHCEAKTRWLCTRRVRQWARRSTFTLWLSWLDRTVEVLYQPRTGYIPMGVTKGRGGRGPVIAVYAEPEVTMKRKSTVVTGSAGGPSHIAPIDCTTLSQFPSLVAHCCVTRYDDGEPRRPGWLTIKTLGAAWIVQVKDPDGACGLTATSQTLDDALTLAELLVSSDDAPWEPDPFLRRSNGKNPKKA